MSAVPFVVRNAFSPQSERAGVRPDLLRNYAPVGIRAVAAAFACRPQVASPVRTPAHSDRAKPQS